MLKIAYDEQSRPAMAEYNGVWYGYVKNLQGDIVGIVDSNGTEAVKYSYDAWGKVMSTSGSKGGTLGKANPFRYRGYVYDEETGLYYLRSRYYNPEWGRFINADVQCGYVCLLLSHNIYAYCWNNAINAVDEDGCDPWWLIIPNWGLIHSAVQYYMVNKYGMRKEVVVKNLPNGKNGRIDLLKDNEAYEIKPNNAKALVRGIKQLQNYLGGVVEGIDTLVVGTLEESGDFVTEDGRFVVKYEATGDGMIGYSFEVNETANDTIGELVESPILPNEIGNSYSNIQDVVPAGIMIFTRGGYASPKGHSKGDYVGSGTYARGGATRGGGVGRRKNR